MVQAAINGHNQFKRAQALEGKALLQAEARYLQRQRRRRGLDEDDSSGDLPEDRAPCVPRELACVDIAFECLFGDFDAGDVSHEIGEGLKPPSDTDTAGPADPDGSLRQASEEATAKALGLDMEDIEVRDAASGEARERRRARHAIAATCPCHAGPEARGARKPHRPARVERGLRRRPQAIGREPLSEQGRFQYC